MTTATLDAPPDRRTRRADPPSIAEGPDLTLDDLAAMLGIRRDVFDRRPWCDLLPLDCLDHGGEGHRIFRGGLLPWSIDDGGPRFDRAAFLSWAARGFPLRRVWHAALRATYGRTPETGAEPDRLRGLALGDVLLPEARFRHLRETIQLVRGAIRTGDPGAEWLLGLMVAQELAQAAVLGQLPEAWDWGDVAATLEDATLEIEAGSGTSDRRDDVLRPSALVSVVPDDGRARFQPADFVRALRAGRDGQ